MSESFRGEFNQKVDGKARVSIPASFRRGLEAGDPAHPDTPRPKFVIVYGGDRQFAECYTMDHMRRTEARIRKLAPGSPQRRYLERNMVTLSQTVEVDDDGRIVLPPKVREKIGLTPDEMKDGVEATFAGALETFQIWKRGTYDAENAAQAETDLDVLPAGMDMASLLPHDPEE